VWARRGTPTRAYTPPNLHGRIVPAETASTYELRGKIHEAAYIRHRMVTNGERALPRPQEHQRLTP
jgi:hypothetical protein